MRRDIVWITVIGLTLFAAACGRSAATPPPSPEAGGDGGSTAAYPQPQPPQAYEPPAVSALSPNELAYAPPGAEDIRVAKYPNPIVVYVLQQTGGGVVGKWTIYQTGRIVAIDGSERTLSPDEVKPIFDVVTTQEFRSLEGRFAPEGSCPDCTIQRILLYGPDEPVEIEIVGEPPSLPAPVQQAIQAITAVIE
ncbi:MAG: hypothetical protein Q9O62_01235 [Ardenticatenia bacterium]|nr:hypothetical protein [Ardenticatenia bacterium]